jgi:hypothetical protein
MYIINVNKVIEKTKMIFLKSDRVDKIKVFTTMGGLTNFFYQNFSKFTKIVVSKKMESNRN